MQLKIFSPDDIAKKTVLVRVDFNVPLSSDSPRVVQDDRRLEQSLPTIKELIKHQSKIVLISHVGRPKSPEDTDLSLKPIATHLEKLLKHPVIFVPKTIGETAASAIQEAPAGSVIVLENLRFHEGEKKNDRTFARELAALAEAYVNDAFSVSHRAHASTEAVTHFLPSFAGLGLAAEIKALSELRDNPTHPLVVVIGGAKISDKVEAVVNLSKQADMILTGGAVANNFLKAEGLEIHKSLIQDAPADLKQKGVDYINVAKDLLDQARTERVWVSDHHPLPKILYPLDVVAAPSTESKETQVIDLTHNAQDTKHDKNLMYLDIGPKTIQLYQEILKSAKTVFWNGPMGLWEQKIFSTGTKQIAQAIADSPATSIVGGGDTVAALDHFELTEKFSYVSTGGGASLEFLAGKELPGIIPLLKK